MDKEKKTELRRLLGELRTDLYKELDGRLSTIEAQLDSISEGIEKDALVPTVDQIEIEEIKDDIFDTVSENVEEYLFGEVAEKLEGHIDEQIVAAEKKYTKRIKEEIKAMKIQYHFKTLLWGVGVVFGGWLTWYGAWGVIGTVPVLQDPESALVIGIVLLASTGALHQKLIG